MKTYAPPRMVQHQPDAVLDQANPVSGTKYTVLDTAKNVRIIAIMVRCIWTAQPTPLEVHVTIDGNVLLGQFVSPENDKDYYAFVGSGSVQLILQLEVTTTERSFMLEGRSVKVEAEITGGTVSNLSARVKWAKL